MDFLLLPEFWLGLGTIIWVNLLLSGDNAVVIALAARSLPADEQKLAVFWGSAGAIALRVILTLFAVTLLSLPWLKLVGGILLLWIGVKLLAPKPVGPVIVSHENLWSAVKIILIADLVMSLDNVIAVAAAAGSAAPTAELENMRYLLLVLGLAISIPIVILGSVIMLKVLSRFPIIILLGAGLIGWIAGGIIVTDPAIVDWVRHSAAWLIDWHVGPIAGAALVLALGEWNKRRPDPAA